MLWQLFVAFLWLLLALVVVAAIIYVWMVRRNLGSLDITTQQTAYDHSQFGHVLTWDKHSLVINGERLMILSGEFHYWRVPDRQRWRPLLLKYKEAGLNCIRIYFSWSYHSPDANVYHFDGNRDVDYLLGICEEIGLYVMVAPGPYICAETQGGGIPIWVIKQRNIRVRHSVNSFFKSYDEKFNFYCKQWFENLCPIIAKHQITYRKGGCVIAFQIENENFETFYGIPIGLHDDMRFLAKCVRDLEITVPLFTNDAWEAGSFITRPESKTLLGKKPFGVDLYGFDKYLCFGPNSNPVSLENVGGQHKGSAEWPEWDPKAIIKGLDKTEELVRSFGDGAALSPIFIPELQGGWFNHYTCKEGYDKVYDFYGEYYTRLIFETCLSQGITMMNIYMMFGGTNWGTLGDPDVYTSYDYSACIREYGHLSGRLRQLRLSLLFCKSFMKYVSQTIPDREVIRPAFSIKSSLSQFLAARRTCLVEHVQLVFFRNFNQERKQSSTITVERLRKEPIQLISKLSYKRSFIGLGNYQPQTGPKLLLATLPIYSKSIVNDEEVWIIQNDEEINGQLAFYGPVEVSGTSDPVVRVDDDISIVSLKSNGFAKVQTVGSSKSLHLICLPENELKTLVKYDDNIFWGPYGIRKDAKSSLEVYQFKKASLHQLVSGEDTKSTFGVRKIELEYKQPTVQSVDLKLIGSRKVDPSSFNWASLEMKSEKVPKYDSLDYCYIGGHVFYKIEFTTENKEVQLVLNVRHRATLILNDVVIGGHITYNLGLYKPGSKAGPDKLSGGHQKYALSPKSGKNVLYVVAESFGMNRCPFTFDDTRNGRGILEISLDVPFKLFVAGVDVRTLSNAFSHSGFPDQDAAVEKIVAEPVKVLELKNVTNPTWHKVHFSYKPVQDECPLRLSLNGTATSYIFFNGHLLARYYGNGDGPQHDFLLPQDLVTEENELHILAYGRDSTHLSDSLSIQIKNWQLEDELGSGNLLDGGKDFILVKNSIKI